MGRLTFFVGWVGLTVVAVAVSSAAVGSVGDRVAPQPQSVLSAAESVVVTADVDSPIERTVEQIPIAIGTVTPSTDVPATGDPATSVPPTTPPGDSSTTSTTVVGGDSTTTTTTTVRPSSTTTTTVTPTTSTTTTTLTPTTSTTTTTQPPTTTTTTTTTTTQPPTTTTTTTTQPPTTTTTTTQPPTTTTTTTTTTTLPPTTTVPPTDPPTTTTTTKPPVDPVRRTIESKGGWIRISYTDIAVRLVAAGPKAGFDFKVEHDGPRRIDVRFASEKHFSRIFVRFGDDGSLVIEVTERPR